MKSPCLSCELVDCDKNNSICENCEKRLKYIGAPVKTEMPLNEKTMRIGDFCVNRGRKSNRRNPNPTVCIGEKHVGFNTVLMESVEPRRIDIKKIGNSVKFIFTDTGELRLHGTDYCQVTSTKIRRVLGGFEFGTYKARVEGNIVTIQAGAK